MYHVKEIFYSLQGEGAQTGRAAVFCRFAGCNLWSGREEDRSRAVCRFCDTDFVGTNGTHGGQYDSPESLVDVIRHTWAPKNHNVNRLVRPLVIMTGGEPLLQLDGPLIDGVHQAGFELAVETNGTLPVPKGCDWVTVSPKAGAELMQRSGDELKLIYPQQGIDPQSYLSLDFRHFFLQPLESNIQSDREANLQAAKQYCLDHPQWRLSIQTHKIFGDPE